ncbi:retinol dehydrogenase 14-like isoform X7 [Dasypus novemcinctus]|uniref:retinol dehydrogenase 14-like isoform X7 n=1 Tax=Dasypus novemcinctus TaxID=9361 RepID=UPI0039C91257
MHVVIAGNNDAKAQEVLRKIKEETLNDKVEFLYCDLASMRSIRQFVQQFRMKNIPLHVLVNNAGVMMVPQRKTQDGFEEHFGLNYLGHFLLTNLLLDLLKESGSPSRGARVITISSATHYVGEMNMDDLQSRSHWQMGSNPQVWNTSSGDETIQSLSDGKVRIQTERNHKISKSSLLHPSMANLIQTLIYVWCGCKLHCPVLMPCLKRASSWDGHLRHKGRLALPQESWNPLSFLFFCTLRISWKWRYRGAGELPQGLQVGSFVPAG